MTRKLHQKFIWQPHWNGVNLCWKPWQKPRSFYSNCTKKNVWNSAVFLRSFRMQSGLNFSDQLHWRVKIPLRWLDTDLVRIHTKLHWAGFYKIHIKIRIYILKSASKIHADFRCRFRSEIFSVHLPFSALMFAHMTGEAKTAVYFQGQPGELWMQLWL